jgi:lipopolysaccharide/colanic/teichoic acid biosynthesis glycosyltransferase
MSFHDLTESNAKDQDGKVQPDGIVRLGIDKVISVIALTLTAPLLFMVAALIGLTMGRPVFFTQTRIGVGGKPFRIFKFRTMRAGPAVAGDQESDEIRLTALGRVLRSTSIDELPGFFNVLKGDMSVVGPRPLLPEYLPLYSHRQARRHLVRPGVTGWAQINGRNLLSWQERLEHDVWYVEHRSLRLDIKIMALTFLRVVRRSGVSAPGVATMTRFTGNPDRGDA